MRLHVPCMARYGAGTRVSSCSFRAANTIAPRGLAACLQYFKELLRSKHELLRSKDGPDVADSRM